MLAQYLVPDTIIRKSLETATVFRYLVWPFSEDRQFPCSSHIFKVLSKLADIKNSPELVNRIQVIAEECPEKTDVCLIVIVLTEFSSLDKIFEEII